MGVTSRLRRRRASNVELAGLELAHPVLNGSGTCDAIAAMRTFGDAGCATSFPSPPSCRRRSRSRPRGGNPPPRLWETPAGLINSIGLPNKGLEGFLERDLPELAGLPVPLIVSVAGFSHDEFAALVEGVAARTEVAALELNVSCPNVKSGCVIGSRARRDGGADGTRAPADGQAADREAHAQRLGRRARSRVAAEAGGADALSLINTLRATAIDPRTGSAMARCGQGGLSGPAVRPVALALTHRRLPRATHVPMVGHGRHPVRAATRSTSCSRRSVRRGRYGELPRSRRRGTRIRDELREQLLRTCAWTRRCMRPSPHARVDALCDVPRSRHCSVSRLAHRFVGQLRPCAPSRLFAKVFFAGRPCTPRSRAYNRRPCPPPPSLPPPPPSVR